MGDELDELRRARAITNASTAAPDGDEIVRHFARGGRWVVTVQTRLGETKVVETMRDVRVLRDWIAEHGIAAVCVVLGRSGLPVARGE